MKKGKKLHRTWVILGFWLLFFIIDVLKKDLFSNNEDDYIFYYYLPGLLLFILFTFPLYGLFKETRKFKIWSRLPFFIILGILFGFLKTYTSWSLYFLFDRLLNQSIHSNLISFLAKADFFYIIESTIIGWIILVLFYVEEVNTKYQQKKVEAAILESQLTDSKLQALKMQLHPHFLFNSLNTIAMSIRAKKNTIALDMVMGLSSLLRSTLSKDIGQLITLEKELELLNKYLFLEKVRFSDNLNILFDIDKEALSVKIPSLLLQPIVENAFKHGFSNLIGVFDLKIKAKIENEELTILIYNSGPKLPEHFNIELHKGIGLTNTINRLAQLYGDNAQLNLENDKNGVKATIKIPVSE